MMAYYDCILGFILETDYDGRVAERHIKVVPNYGVTCERMTTNGDPRYIAQIASKRREIVERHHFEGIDLYALDVVINGISIADKSFEDALQVIIDAADSQAYREIGFDFMMNAANQNQKERIAQ